MSKSYPQLWSRLYGTPLLITPDKAAVIEQVFRAHMQSTGGAVAPQAAVAEAPAPRPRSAYAGIRFQSRPDKPYLLTSSGIAVVQAIGTLVQRGSWLDAMSGLVSYDTIAMQLDQALQDTEVRAVLLELDSPGGEGTGIVEMADRILAARGSKPVWAIANEMACSAAYWIGCTAERLYVPITGLVANIGAVVMHVNQSRRDAQMGYEYTFIYDGARKIDGNSHQPLSDPALAWITAEVERFGLLFREHVAAMRGLSEAEVRATQAGVLSPPDALEAGFIDGIQTFAETILALEDQLRVYQATPYQFTPAARSTVARAIAAPVTPSAVTEVNPSPGRGASTLTEGVTMSATQAPAALTTVAPAAASASTSTTPAADLESVRTAAHAEGVKAGEVAGRAAGVKAERERIRAILGCDEARERTQLAAHLAMETDTDPDAAKKLLEASPKAASAGAGASPFASAMASLQNPQVGAEADTAVTEAPKAIASSASIYELRRRSTNGQ